MELIEGTPFPNIFESGTEHESKTCLLQGDIISGELKLFGREEGVIGYIVMSNSCDLEHNNIRKISLAPIYPIDIWFKENSGKKHKELANLLFKEVNYGRKLTFFISPLKQFGDNPSIAYLDDIRSIKSNITIFNWHNIPEKDNAKLVKFLRHILEIKWVKNVDIEKDGSGEVICVSTKDNCLFLIHKNKEDKATLLMDDGRIGKLKATVDDNDKINISFNAIDLLLKYKLRSIKSPWREQLGHKVGNIFNRVSTFTPIEDTIIAWANINNRR